jgi:hypothetical protein
VVKPAAVDVDGADGDADPLPAVLELPVVPVPEPSVLAVPVLAVPDEAEAAGAFTPPFDCAFCA